MKYHTFCAVTLFGFLLFVSCRKNEINLNNPCEQFESLVDLQGIPLFHQVYPSYGVPSFNPSNSDEIIFFYAPDNSPPPFQLLKFNLSSKEYQIIFEGQFGIRPRWGKKGWILLSLQNELGNDGFNIWKIKENGDSLTQLTTNGRSFFPEWNNEGNRLIYQIGNTSPTKFVIADQMGNAIDTTFVGVGSGGSWQHDSLVANATFKGLFVGNPYRGIDSYQLISDVENNSLSVGGAEWINDEYVIWSHVTGIYSTNITNDVTIKIKETCNSKYYQLPTYSSELDKVVFQKIERIETDDEIGELVSGLYMMNPDGTNEEKIEVIE